MVYIKFGIVFELFVYKIHGDSDGAFLSGRTEILNSRLNEMDVRNIEDPRIPMFCQKSLGLLFCIKIAWKAWNAREARV